MLQEDADAVGLSILSGAHMTLVPRIAELLKQENAEDVILVVGGTIPSDDIPELKELGVAEVFTPGRPGAGHHRLHPRRRCPPRVRRRGSRARPERPPARTRRAQGLAELVEALLADLRGEAALDVREDLLRGSRRLARRSRSA